MTQNPTQLLDATASNALATALDAAALMQPLVVEHGAQRFVLHPQTHKITTLDLPNVLPPHVIQKVTLDDPDSLIAYVNRYRDHRSLLIADLDSGQVHARLDWHNAEVGGAEPMPCAHTATLRLRNSEEFDRWNKIAGQMHSQVAFAEFLEENATDICDPDPAVMIEMSRDLEATQAVNFRSTTRLESGDRAFAYESETKVRSELVVPREFALSIPLWRGAEQTVIRCAFRFKVEERGLSMGFVWRRVEYQRQADFRQIATRVAEDTGLPLIFGRA